jgi:hypothetical protein
MLALFPPMAEEEALHNRSSLPCHAMPPLTSLLQANKIIGFSPPQLLALSKLSIVIYAPGPQSPRFTLSDDCSTPTIAGF